MFGQMTPSSEEEEGMRLGNEIDTPEILQPKQSVPRAPLANTNTPEDSDVDEDFEFSFEEFEKRYKPLSNLPTPPWSDSSPAESVFEESDGMLNPEFYGAAKYLVMMIPRNAFREPPSVKLLHSILQRANLKLEVMALAGCILDCLSSRFVRQWRSDLCGKLSTGCSEAGVVIVVVALCIAMKFMEDSSYTSRYWAICICEELFSLDAFMTTERLILSDLNYSLHGISAPETLEWIMDEIKQYAAQAPVEASNSSQLSTERPGNIDRSPSPFPILS